MELLVRLTAVRRAENGTFAMPATQSDLADALGITNVHANRVLQSMRAGGLMTLARRRVAIDDLDRLQRLAMFNDRYLHLASEGRHLSANGD